MAAAVPAAPRLARFLGDEPDDAERGHRIDSPGGEQQVRDKAHHDDQGEPAARDAFNGIGTHRSATELAGHSDLSACEPIHDRHG
jgi:hypothetical protein